MIHWENGIFENFEFYFIELYNVINCIKELFYLESLYKKNGTKTKTKESLVNRQKDGKKGKSDNNLRQYRQ
jgi:hypothetical protein